MSDVLAAAASMRQRLEVLAAFDFRDAEARAASTSEDAQVVAMVRALLMASHTAFPLRPVECSFHAATVALARRVGLTPRALLAWYLDRDVLPTDTDWRDELLPKLDAEELRLELEIIGTTVGPSDEAK